MHRRSFIKVLGSFISILSLRINSDTPKNQVSFNHGIASGDPTNTNVIIWSKLTVNTNSSIRVNWEVAIDKSFKIIINKGTVLALKSKDHTIKKDVYVDAKYNGLPLFYRFNVGQIYSPVGQTLTLPANNPSNFKIAFCSCSNYPAGFFNAYESIADDKSIDLVLHLGDYIYEYDENGYATEDSNRLGRVVNPKHEIVSLKDYRLRHAQYKTDKQLKKLHSLKPMICIWDDHEFTNNAWKNGAENHDKDEGLYKARKVNAIKAYYEWMPIRETQSKSKIWRSFKVGNLFQLLMLDTRIYARNKQVDIEKYFKNGSFNKKAYLNALNNPNRNLLGKKQLDWLDNQVSSSFQWSIFGQQLLSAPTYVPGFLKTLDVKTLPSYLHRYISLAGTNIPYNTDQWDGYPNERERFYKIISKSKSSIVIAGDTHSSWVSNLYSKKQKFVGVELGTPSINSPNFSDVPIFNKNIKKLENSFINENKNLQWMDGKNKCYTLIDINNEFVDTSFVYVTSVKKTQYKSFIGKNFKLFNNSKVIV